MLTMLSCLLKLSLLHLKGKTHFPAICVKESERHLSFPEDTEAKEGPPEVLITQGCVQEQ